MCIEKENKPLSRKNEAITSVEKQRGQIRRENKLYS